MLKLCDENLLHSLLSCVSFSCFSANVIRTYHADRVSAETGRAGDIIMRKSVHR